LFQVENCKAAARAGSSLDMKARELQRILFNNNYKIYQSAYVHVQELIVKLGTCNQHHGHFSQNLVIRLNINQPVEMCKESKSVLLTVNMRSGTVASFEDKTQRKECCCHALKLEPI